MKTNKKIPFGLWNNTRSMLGWSWHLFWVLETKQHFIGMELYAWNCALHCRMFAIPGTSANSVPWNTEHQWPPPPIITVTTKNTVPLHSDTPRITVFLLAENHLNWEKGLDGKRKTDSRLSEGFLARGDRWYFVSVLFSHSSNKTKIGRLVGENDEKVFIRTTGTHLKN